MIAARYGYTDIMKILIDNGADVNARSDGGYTALMRAARNGQTKAVKILIDNHANINLKNNGGVSALWHAAAHNHSDIVHMLLENGADPNDIRDLPNYPMLQYFIPLMALIPTALFGAAFAHAISTHRQRRTFRTITLLVAAVLWLGYTGYEFYISRVYPLSSVPIRVDLLLIWPVLLIVSGIAVLVFFIGRTRRSTE